MFYSTVKTEVFSQTSSQVYWLVKHQVWRDDVGRQIRDQVEDQVRRQICRHIWIQIAQELDNG